MNVYNIYHAAGPDRFQEIEDQIRIYAGHVEATSLEMAFRESQNFEFHWNSDSPCRSTSVGDVIELNNKFYMVCNTGFRLILDEEEEEPVYEPDPYDTMYGE